MPGTQQLYFIAIIPCPELSEVKRGIQQHAFEHFHSRKAMAVLPHLTLKAPFRLPAGERAELVDWFCHLKTGVPPFNIRISNYGCFPNKKQPVIFLQPVVTAPLLKLHQVILQQFNSQFPALLPLPNETIFKPHFTIAYRDLKPASFQVAWQEYRLKEFQAEFAVDKIHLLHHAGKTWESLASCELT
jgi:2'-5' RNA ligase